MKTIIHKPYIIFWAVIPIMIIYGLFLGDKMLDINIHDTYYGISKASIWHIISHIFAIYGILYCYNSSQLLFLINLGIGLYKKTKIIKNDYPNR